MVNARTRILYGKRYYNLGLHVYSIKIVRRIFLEGEKVQVSPLLEVLGSQTAIPNSFKGNSEGEARLNIFLNCHSL